MSRVNAALVSLATGTGRWAVPRLEAVAVVEVLFIVMILVCQTRVYSAPAQQSAMDFNAPANLDTPVDIINRNMTK